MAFYDRLRNYYGIFAIFWLCMLRVAFKHLLGVTPNACAFIFPVLSLDIVNEYVTALIAFVAQSAMNVYIFEHDQFMRDDLIFNAAYVVIVIVAIKVIKEK